MNRTKHYCLMYNIQNSDLKKWLKRIVTCNINKVLVTMKKKKETTAMLDKFRLIKIYRQTISNELSHLGVRNIVVPLYLWFNNTI